MNNKFKEIIKQCVSFDDFNEQLKNLSNKEKGDHFEYFCKLFFLFDNKWDNLIKNSWLLNNTPLEIKEKLNIPNIDIGIDIVLETFDKKFYAVQCKYRSNINNEISWKELSTFFGLTFGISGKFKKGIFISNTINPNKKVDGCKNVINVLYHTLKETSINTFILIKNFLMKEKYKKIIFEPRNYQNEIINKAINYFKNNDKGRLYMPCGTGKTLVCYWIYEKLNLNNVCIAVPSLYLLSQVYNTWSEMINNRKYLLIGSDAEIKEQPDIGLILTTDKEEIQKFLIKNNKYIIITTYQSSDILCSVLTENKMKLDMCIYDEAHKTVGNSNRTFSSLLNNELKIKKRLFTTATEKIYKGINNLSDDDDDEFNILSMDDKNIYGDIIYTYSLKKAIEDMHLCDYRIVCPLINKQCFKSMLKENKYVIDKNLCKDEIEMRYYMSAYLVCRCIKNYGLKHILTFNNTNANANKFYKLLQNFIKLMKIKCNCYYLTGESNMKKRKKVVNDFINSETSIISSARIFTEGVDIKEVDCVCFVDNKISVIDIIQSIGRCLRKSDDKKLGNILLPSVIEFNKENENIFDNNDFITIKAVLKSIGTTDDRITDEFIISDGKRINGTNKKFNIDVKDIEKYSDIEIDFNKFENNFETIICDRWGKVIWEKRLKEVKNYIVKYNERPSTHDKKQEIKKLGYWISNQQNKYKKKNDIMKNKEIRNKWKKFVEEYRVYFMTNEEAWNNILKEVKKYIDKYNERPSRNDKNQEIKKLGYWINTQQNNYKKKNDIMKNKEIRKKWEKFIEDYEKYFLSNEEAWNNILKEIKNYINKYNKRPSQYDKEQNIKKLSKWISTQQKNYKKKSCIMSNKEIRKKWKKFIIEYGKYFLSNKEAWNNILKEVKKYIDKHNKRPSCMSKKQEIKKLGSWIITQQNNYKKKSFMMSNKEIRKKWEKFIEDYEKYFISNEETWNNILNEVKKYIDKHNKRPPESSKKQEIKKLGKWLSHQQENYKKKRFIMINKEIRKKWKKFIKEYEKYFLSNEETWKNILKEVKKYIDKNNKRPSTIDKNQKIKKIGQWLSHQQNNYKKKNGIMSNKKIRKKWEKFINNPNYEKYFN